MLFNSFTFFVFALVVYPLYYCLALRWQNRLLLAASMVFYGWWDWRFLVLLIFTTTMDYYLGWLIDRSDSERARLRRVTLSVVLNLIILGFFKYYNFFAFELTKRLEEVFGASTHVFVLQVVLPVGISFYTFQSMSYTIDIYRRRLKPAKTLADFALYVSFFPQLVAGPIERAGQLLPQLTLPRVISAKGVQEAGWLLLWGFYKKLFVADNLSPIAEALISHQVPLTAWEVLLLSYVLTVQIYCDFSGYSDIARGLAKLLGIELMVNFRFPLFAGNPRDFWRRWHISLSEWLRDYVYVPLGGDKVSRIYLLRNVFVTMGLGGLWHGAAWQYLLWGLYHAALIVLHRIFISRVPGAQPRQNGRGNLSIIARVLVFQHLFAFSMLLFRTPSCSELWRLLTTMTFSFGSSHTVRYLELKFICLTGLMWFIDFKLFRKNDAEAALSWPLSVRVALYLMLFYSIVWFGELGGQHFVYFQF